MDILRLSLSAADATIGTDDILRSNEEAEVDYFDSFLQISINLLS